MIRRPPRSTQSRSSAASDVYKRQVFHDAINDEMTRPATSSPYVRPSTTLSLPHSTLWRDANNSSPIIPLGTDTPPMRSTSPMTAFPRKPVHQLSNNVVLVVEPRHQVLHMFGALQVTGSYSLSGTLRVSLPHAMDECRDCLLYTSPSPRDQRGSRMPSSA